jgi:hypothetical protein
MKGLNDFILKAKLNRGRRWPGKTRGAFVFALNFLCILSFFPRKRKYEDCSLIMLIFILLLSDEYF